MGACGGVARAGDRHWGVGIDRLAAWSQTGSPVPLQLSVPVLSPGEMVEIDVSNTPLGESICPGSVIGFGWHRCNRLVVRQGRAVRRTLLRCVGAMLVALGVLMQGDGAPWFLRPVGPRDPGTDVCSRCIGVDARHSSLAAQHGGETASRKRKRKQPIPNTGLGAVTSTIASVLP